MVESFENDVLPVVQKFARKVLKDEDQQATSVVMAWWYWCNRSEDFPASVWAQCGVRAARSGRDVPGMPRKRLDVWDVLTRWSGAGMQNVADRRPGPDKIAEDRELLELFVAGLSGTQLAIFEMLMDDRQGVEIARRINCSPPRVSQVRSEWRKKWNEL